MQKSILVVLVLLFVGLQQASARRIHFGKAENIKVVHDFPNTEEYRDEDGNYFDLGILYETYGASSNLPFWLNKEPRIVGLLNTNTDYYLELDPEFVDEIIAAHNLDKEEMLTLSYWDKYLGSTLVGGGLLLALLYAIIFAKKEEEDVIEVIEPDKNKA